MDSILNSEAYIDMSKLAFKSNAVATNIIKQWIWQAQKDAYNEALKDVLEEFVGVSYFSEDKIINMKL